MIKPIIAAVSIAFFAAGCIEDDYGRGGRYHRGADQHYSPSACDTWLRQARNGNEAARNRYNRNCRGRHGGSRQVDNRHPNNRPHNTGPRGRNSGVSPQACNAWRDAANSGDGNSRRLYNQNCKRR